MLGDVLDSAQAAWLDKVAQLRAKAAELDQAENDLYAVHDDAFAMGLGGDWNTQLSNINSLRSQYQAALSAIDTASGWWTSWSNTVASGTSSILDWLGIAQAPDITQPLTARNLTVPVSLQGVRGLGALGIAQLIVPVSLAVIVGLIAASAAVIAGVYAYIDTVRQNKKAQLIASGVDPATASATVDGAYPTRPGASFMDNLSSIASVAVIGLAIVFVLPKLLERR